MLPKWYNPKMNAARVGAVAAVLFSLSSVLLAADILAAHKAMNEIRGLPHEPVLANVGYGIFVAGPVIGCLLAKLVPRRLPNTRRQVLQIILGAGVWLAAWWLGISCMMKA